MIWRAVLGGLILIAFFFTSTSVFYRLIAFAQTVPRLKGTRANDGCRSSRTLLVLSTSLQAFYIMSLPKSHVTDVLSSGGLQREMGENPTMQPAQPRLNVSGHAPYRHARERIAHTELKYP